MMYEDLELQRDYADLTVGVVDASLLALVERLGEPKGAGRMRISA